MDGEVEDEGRRFWKNAAMHFHAAHLSNGRTHVVEVLEAEDSRHVGDTFEVSASGSPSPPTVFCPNIFFALACAHSSS